MFQIFVDDNNEPAGEKVIKLIDEIACSRPWMKKIYLYGDDIYLHVNILIVVLIFFFL